MQAFVLLLRGINVGGHRKVKMAELKVVLQELDFQNIATYIQSGNVIFSTEETNISKLKHTAEEAIKVHFGFAVSCFIIPKETFLTIIENNPFIETEEITKLYITFLNETPNPEKLETLKTFESSDELFILKNNTLYFCYENGYGKAKIANPFIEKKLNLQATTRNWKTMMKLLEMLNS
ncbi:hypothetical protein JoomaDRAFT_1215 [Galbibacter orientalis DSM 19592]|uniref:DUF1697 domain-containing protein n=1 Tax=Galbibacter orientalis DSM 19592 TaxID=926559 RepID=I3C3P0_9FLAO|nr:DUF1697 domain-containing protein [Galbibacter orientalis]EIJ38233.1 hypothetical protein JoomaDRAFT_1215 [Galbibacter orientalis DSM 19592]